MPPRRITYWTGTWDPRQEAISKEVDLLRGLGGGCQTVVSFSPGQSTSIDIARRVIRLSSRRDWLLRAIAPAIERSGTITHIFGSLDSWHLLRAVGRRPAVMTVVLSGRPLHRRMWSHISQFAAESESLATELVQHGIPAERVRVIYPGVDLHQYRPGESPSGPFRLLFASSPSDPAEFDVRGISLLVEAARLCPDVEVVLLWREWGDRAAGRRALARLSPPSNVHIEAAGGRDMPAIYRASHAIACLYAPEFGKSCPNSVVEAMACGLPALVSDSVGIARLVRDSGAGFAVPRSVSHVVDAIRSIRQQRRGMAAAARRLAEQTFDVRAFLESYVQLYAGVTAPPPARRAA